MSDADSERDPLDLLAEEFAERFRRGETPAVSEYVERYPQWADQLRELLPPVAHLEKLKRLKQAARADGPACPHAGVPNGPQLKQLGDYRILREVGRGGMGVVYEAVQQSLGRHVALKVLPAHSLLDPKKLERFRREAQAAAALHHTNIVPVFGVGEQDGLHYYVMQFIEGLGLDRVLVEWKQGTSAGRRPRTAAGRNRSTDSWHGPAPHPEQTALRIEDRGSRIEKDSEIPHHLRSSILDPRSSNGHWRRVARIGAEAADALHYAHQQGVLHRDIKPANLLLDTHGAVWITDFGLAKVTDEQGLTSTGDILGTLQYMAPESFERRGDARSDVYSLGVTLYELLTLEPAFRGGDRAQVLGAIYGRELVPPRKVNPAVPRDLETIVLKATARDPGRRYPTAQALAADLRRFLEDRPIRARRTTPTERLWRWCRRNPAVASLAAALLLVFLSGFAGVVWKWQEAEAEGRRAEANLQRAEKNEQLSLQALEDIFEHFAARDAGPNFGPKKGGPPRRFDAPEDIVLLQTILKFYDKFARENATNAKLRREAARAYRRVGDIEQRFNQRLNAATAYRRAAAILEELALGPAATAESRLEWAETFTQPENWPEEGRGLKEGEERLRKALAIAADPGEAPSGRRIAAAARAQLRLGSVLQQQARPAEAEAAYRDAVQRWRSMAEEPRKTPMWEVDLCTAQRALAAFLAQHERLADARVAIQESIDDLEGWRAGPVEWVRNGLLREQYQSLAKTLTRLGETAQAAKATRAAEQLGENGPGPKKGSRPGRDKRPPS
jgi:serine/threonine protein kinase